MASAGVRSAALTQRGEAVRKGIEALQSRLRTHPSQPLGAGRLTDENARRAEGVASSVQAALERHAMAGRALPTE
jgi:hypothetical protein